MANGDMKEYADFTIKAVPADNLASSYHPKVFAGYVPEYGRQKYLFPAIQKISLRWLS
jgi:hypothetical protein